MLRAAQNRPSTIWRACVFVALIAVMALGAVQPAKALDLEKFTPLPKHMQACEFLRDDIRAASRRYIPKFPHWQALMAQTFQESRCRLDAVSPAGAQGPLQIMPGTERDLARKYGAFNVFSKQSIAHGARYQAAQMHQWRGRGRPPAESWRLGLASYNAGLGNILKAQKACEGQRDWRDIRLCLQDITGHHSAETITYVRRIERWWTDLDPNAPQIFRGEMAVRGWFHFDENGQAPGSFWPYASGWVTARHVVQQQAETAPPFTSGKVRCADGVIDACLIGGDLHTEAAPPELKEGDRVRILGVPGGSADVSERRGAVYFRRQFPRDSDFSTPTVIVLLDAPTRGRFDFGPKAAAAYPVFVGMSGGVVLDMTGRPRGVLVAAGAPTELLPSRPGLEQTVDIVDLADFHAVFE